MDPDAFDVNAFDVLAFLIYVVVESGDPTPIRPTVTVGPLVTATATVGPLVRATPRITP